MAKVLVLLAEGFEEIEAISIIDVLRRAEIDVITVSTSKDKKVTGAHSISVISDSLLDTEVNNYDSYDMVVLPGGLPGAYNLRDDNRVIEFIQKMNSVGKYTAAICAAPIVFAKAGILEGKLATSYPGHLEKLNLKNTNLTKDRVVIDGKVITSRGPATALEFALALVEILAGESKKIDLSNKMLLTSNN